MEIHGIKQHYFFSSSFWLTEHNSQSRRLAAWDRQCSLPTGHCSMGIAEMPATFTFHESWGTFTGKGWWLPPSISHCALVRTHTHTEGTNKVIYIYMYMRVLYNSFLGWLESQGEKDLLRCTALSPSVSLPLILNSTFFFHILAKWS